MNKHTKTSIMSRRSGVNTRTRSTLLAGVLTAVMWTSIAVPEGAAAVMTQAGGHVQVNAGWNSDVPVHPGVPLTMNDRKSVDLGFQNSSTSAVGLSAGGSQTLADVIDPIEIDPLPISWSVSATADMGGSALPGRLRAWAKATASQTPTSQSYSYISPKDGLARSLSKFDPVVVSGVAEVVVGWADVFTITSPTLSPGTPINIRFTVVLESTVQNPRGTSGAKMYLIGGGDAVLENRSGTSVITKNGTIGSAVGKSLELRGALQVNAHAGAYADPLGQRYGSVGSMDAFTLAMNTGHFYLDLDPGIDAVIVSESGTSYATPLPEPAAPALNIQSAGGNVLISWPAAVQGYQLETTATLGADNQWIAVRDTSVVVELQNVVTNSISNSERFYRLKK